MKKILNLHKNKELSKNLEDYQQKEKQKVKILNIKYIEDFKHNVSIKFIKKPKRYRTKKRKSIKITIKKMLILKKSKKKKTSNNMKKMIKKNIKKKYNKRNLERRITEENKKIRRKFKGNATPKKIIKIKMTKNEKKKISLKKLLYVLWKKKNNMKLHKKFLNNFINVNKLKTNRLRKYLHNTNVKQFKQNVIKDVLLEEPLENTKDLTLLAQNFNKKTRLY